MASNDFNRRNDLQIFVLEKTEETLNAIKWPNDFKTKFSRKWILKQ